MKASLVYMLLGSVLLLTPQSGQAQSRARTSAASDTAALPDLSPLGDNPNIDHHAPPDDKVYTYVEQMPTFPGGNDELLKFFAQHYRSPKVRKKDHLPASAKLIIRFVVDKNGAVRDPEFLRGSISYDHDLEALRVARMLPRFQPGRQNGRPVNVYYTVPLILEVK